MSTTKCVGCGKTVGGAIGAFGETLPAGSVCLTCRNKIRGALLYQFLSAEQIKSIIGGTLAVKDARPQVFSDLVRAELQAQNLGYSAADEIAKYKKLLDDGAISVEEYEQQKKRLLAL